MPPACYTLNTFKYNENILKWSGSWNEDGPVGFQKWVELNICVLKRFWCVFIHVNKSINKQTLMTKYLFWAMQWVWEAMVRGSGSWNSISECVAGCYFVYLLIFVWEVFSPNTEFLPVFARSRQGVTRSKNEFGSLK